MTNRAQGWPLMRAVPHTTPSFSPLFFRAVASLSSYPGKAIGLPPSRSGHSS